jgi:hypothetical protein
MPIVNFDEIARTRLMHKLNRILFAAALMFAATTSQAALIGSIGFSQDTGVITMNPAGAFNAYPYSVVTSGATFSTVGNSGTGSFGALGSVNLTMTPSTLALASTASVSGVTLGFDGFTFSATSGSVAVASTNLVQILYSGTVSSANDSGSALVTLTFQRTTATSPITFAGSLVAPAVPEPSSIALAGIGLAAAGMFGLRKRLAK